MGQNDFFPNFDEWRKHAIETKGGLVFAPHDFFVSYGLNQTRHYFTWLEAKGFEEKVLKPEGWRLPTAEEWEYLILEGVIGPHYCRLKLEANGYIAKDSMVSYRRTLSPTGIRYVTNLGERGYYWASDEGGFDTALALGFGSRFIDSDKPVVHSYMKDYGRSVRCIAI